MDSRVHSVAAFSISDRMQHGDDRSQSLALEGKLGSG